jgi:hypothetical protein
LTRGKGAAQARRVRCVVPLPLRPACHTNKTLTNGGSL